MKAKSKSWTRKYRGTPTAPPTVPDPPRTTTVAVASPDREILVALYNATDGPNWGSADNWLTDAPLGSWYGVDVDTLGRVTELRLPLNNLSGSLPAELTNLASLTYLALSWNELSGPIPMDLGNNELTSPIPQSFLALDMLEVLDFENNAGLCAPNTTEFVTWLQSIDEVSGPYCSVSSCASSTRVAGHGFVPGYYSGSDPRQLASFPAQCICSRPRHQGCRTEVRGQTTTVSRN